MSFLVCKKCNLTYSDKEGHRCPFPHLPTRQPSVAPDSNPKTAFGALKPSTHAIPPVAIVMLGAAMEEGRTKYGLFNWRKDAISKSVYVNAIERHLLAYRDGQMLDPESPEGKVPHLAKVMACCAILLDGELHGTLGDDLGGTQRAVDTMTTLTKTKT